MSALREPSFFEREVILRETSSLGKFQLIQAGPRCANPRGFSLSLEVRAWSQGDGGMDVRCRGAAVFAYFVPFEVSKPVKAQVVFLDLDFGNQTAFQFFEQCAVDLALEHGFLHPLPHAFAEFGDPA